MDSYTASPLRRWQAWALNPWLVLASLVAGAAFGAWKPGLARYLGVIAALYVDLLQMIVLPFMVSAVIFSLQSLFREGATRRTLARVVWVFLVFAVATTVIGLLVAKVTEPGTNLPPETRAAFGRIVHNDSRQGGVAIELRAPDTPDEAREPGILLRDMLGAFIPSNVFAAFAQGETLKALVFALLFGFAAGQVPARVSQGLIDSLGTIYASCQTLTHWFNYPVLFVMFCMASAHIGQGGFEALRPMAGFVASFYAATALLLAISVMLIKRRSSRSWREVLGALRAPFAMAFATRSSAVCMPAMIEAMADKLGFSRTRTELLVPLSVALLRTGPILFYVSATLFIAALYGRELGVHEIGVVALVCLLTGFASAGASGVVTLSMMGTASAYLGLPFEAAFALFLAVEPLCDMARSALIVVSNCAAVALICPAPLEV